LDSEEAYPINSFARLLKFYSRGMIPLEHAMRSASKIILDIKSRGYLNLEDFAAQVDGLENNIDSKSWDEAKLMVEAFPVKGVEDGESGVVGPSELRTTERED
jgi:hypothetical protein